MDQILNSQLKEIPISTQTSKIYQQSRVRKHGHLDVIAEDLAVPLCSSLTQSLASLATSGHPLAVVESLKGADVKVSVFIKSVFDI